MSSITPILDKVLIRMDPLEAEFGDSGIARPDIALEMPMAGTVAGRGPGGFDEKGRRIPMEVRRGDRVAIPWRTGDEQTINGALHRWVQEHQILGIVED